MTATANHDLSTSTLAARTMREGGNDALRLLEDALSSPTPGRTRAWRQRVDAALEALISALEEQSATDARGDSLLSEIAQGTPRLLPRIEALREQHRSIRDDLADVRRTVHGDGDIDVDAVRERLSEIGRRYRRHRSAEADLVYEAVNVDLGIGD